MQSPFAEAAQALWEANLSVMPLTGKKPVVKNWNHFCSERPSEDEIAAWMHSTPGTNIGLPLGTQNGLCIVDIDTNDPGVIAAIKSVLPASPWERVGKKGCALLYRNPNNIKNFSVQGIVDFLAAGRQVVIPPSIHPDTNLPYTANADLAEIYSSGVIPNIPDNIKALLYGASARAAEAGSRHNTLTSNIGIWRNAGLIGEELAAAAAVWNEHRTGGEPLPAEEVTEACAWGDSIKGGHSDKKSKVDRTTIADALKGWGIVLSFNEMKSQIEINGLENFGPALCDAAINRLRMRMEKEQGQRCPKDYFYDAVADIAQSMRIHPVREYLAEVQPKWDGVSRLDGWLAKYCGAEDSSYNHAVGALTLIAAVRRARQPGCKFDTMMVLEGGQGCGKSTALSILAGSAAWFTDSFPFGSGSKVIAEECGGRWIIEASELAGLRKSDHETLKATITRTEDIARPAYGRFAVATPRGFIVIGTTNSESWLSDPTGNRRYLPVKVTSFDLEELKKDRDQLWAEAASREADGESIALDPELWDEAAAQQEARHLPSPLADELSVILGGLQGKVSAGSLWGVLGIPLERRHALGSQLAAAMQGLGFKPVKCRFGGNGSERGYERGAGGVIRPCRLNSTLQTAQNGEVQ